MCGTTRKVTVRPRSDYIIERCKGLRGILDSPVILNVAGRVLIALSSHGFISSSWNGMINGAR